MHRKWISFIHKRQKPKKLWAKVLRRPKLAKSQSIKNQNHQFTESDFKILKSSTDICKKYFTMLNHISSRPQCCQNCRGSTNHDFKPVVNLKNSGLLIYIHENKSNSKRMRSSDENKGSIILCNTGNKELQRFDYIAELCQYRTKCYKCKILVQRIRDLIDNIYTVKGDEIIGVCDHCKRSKEKIKCTRCEYIVNKFIKNEVKSYMDREHQYRVKLDKMRKILLSIMQGHIICKHNIYLDSESKTQLDNLLDNLNLTLPSRQPVIDNFPEKNVHHDLSLEKSQMLSKVISKLSIETRNDVTLDSSSSDSDVMCVCKYLMNRKRTTSLEEFNNKNTPFLINIIPRSANKAPHNSSNKEITKQKSIPNVSLGTPESQISVTNNHDISNKKLNNDMSAKATKQKSMLSVLQSTLRSPLKEIVGTNHGISKKLNKDIQNLNEINVSQTSKAAKDKSPKDISKELQAHSDNNNIILKMMKQREKNRTQRRKSKEKQNKTKFFSKIEDLPIIRSPKKRVDIEVAKSESIVECKENRRIYIDRMIKGCNIVPYDALYNREETIKLPLLFKIQTDCSAPPINAEESCSKYSYVEDKIRKPNRNGNGTIDNSGIILYKLSNSEFIDKGWTKLPTIKIMRRMNIYKMMPCSKFDWFEHHKTKTLFYDSQEKLAEVYENGCGKWFYKNGIVALEYYNDAEFNMEKRCVIYSSGEDLETKKKTPVNVLACFSHLGHGIIYDNYSNIRLKYNQSEGLIVDKKISPPSRWKWHTLNDPPILHPVFVNTFEKDSACLDNNSNKTENVRKEDEEMVAIELQNLLREKAIKLHQEFKPFQIKIKTVKINDYFSLRIIDQANIYIQFRCGRICHRFNIGMILKNDEIIGTEATEVTEVATPYDLNLLDKSI